MTPEAQRIAIAEACPKVWIGGDNQTYYYTHNGVATVFDPLNDLNAMHESLKSQSEMFQCHFSNELWRIAKSRGIYFHQLTAKDWSDGFVNVLQSKRDSLNSTHE